MKNNALIIFLVSVAVFLAGVNLVLEIEKAVSSSIAPLTVELGELKAGLRAIQRDISADKAANRGADLPVQLAALNQRLAAMETNLKNIAAAQKNQPRPPSRPAEQPDANKVYVLPDGASPVAGKKEAPVTIVAFFDLQCPFCNRFYPPIKEVLKAYPDKVRFIVKNYPLPFHPNALPAAKLALAASLQGKYFEALDILMQNGADVSEAKVKEYAQKIGIKVDQWMKDYKSRDAQWQKIIDEDTALAGQVAVRGTPSF